MKKTVEKIAVCIMVAVVSMIAAVTAHAATESTRYEMVWSDEFNGTELNTDNWVYDIGNGGSNVGWGNNEYEYYTDRTDNVKVENGQLVITAMAEDYVSEDTGGSYSYTSGRIKTSGLQSFKYGKLVARMKLPATRGLWPAFWMLGYNDKGWPYCGEIDIMETWNELNFAQGTIHWVNDSTKPNQDSYDAGSVKMTDKTQWHTYGIIWTPKTIEWTLDGTVYKTFDITGSDKSELRAEFYFLINCAVGGNLAYYLPDDTFVSDTVEVDYVRVYQRESDGGSYSGTWSNEEKAQVPAYTVKYKNRGKVISKQTVLAGETTQVPTVTRKGYEFLGWYNGNNKVTESTEINGNITVKAKWKKIKVKKAVITSTKQRYKKYITVRFKVKGDFDGFQVKVGKKKTTTPSKVVTIGKFKAGKTYKVKVRAYRIDSKGKKIYGKWSKSKRISVKN